MAHDSTPSDRQLPPLTKPIVLVGLMGAGKTTVGRRLASELDLPFYDADHEIEKASDMAVAEYFDKYGEAAFRDGEQKVIERLLDGPICVLATGGGAFLADSTRKLVLEKAVSVWLKADLDVLVKRTSVRNTRPLLRNGDPRKILSRLMTERDPLYAQSDITVESKDSPHKVAVEMIIDGLHDLPGHRSATPAEKESS